MFLLKPVLSWIFILCCWRGTEGITGLYLLRKFTFFIYDWFDNLHLLIRIRNQRNHADGEGITSVLCSVLPAKASIFMENRIRVVLIGQTLTFNLSLNVPANHTYTKPKCYHQRNRISWGKENDEKRSRQSRETLVKEMLELKMYNVSFSGNYFCSYEGQEVHWVVLVRGKTSICTFYVSF